MAISALKAAPLTALDATPPFLPNAGVGGKGRLCHVNGFVTTVAADSIGSTYRLARIPSDAIVKQVILESEAQAAGATDIGLYYSTSSKDGTQPSLQGLVISAAFYASAVALTAASRADVTNESGTNTLALRNLPAWQAAGLASDPGGYFDVVATLTTAITTGAARLGAEVFFVGE